MADYKQLVENKRQAMLDALLLSIESNPKKWESGWVSVDVPYNAASNKNYNGLNALFLYVKAPLNGFNDARWVTFNQAKELGASIKAGEKASEVFYWTKYDKATKKPFDRETVEGMTDDERAEYIKENVRPVLKFYQVFNAAQCKNFPESTKRSTTMSDAERAEQNERIETIIKNSAAPIIHDGRAYYSPTKDNIHLPVVQSFKTMQDYYATALHEIGHSTGHQSRLNRDLTGRFGSESYAIEELRAELASVFIQSELGINLGEAEIANHGAYLKSWLSAVKKDANVFYHAAADAGKISDYIKQNYLTSKVQNNEDTEQAQLLNYEMKALNIVLSSNGAITEYIRFEGFNHAFNTQQLVTKYGGRIENGQIVITPELQNSYDKLRSELENKGHKENAPTEQTQQVEQVEQVRHDGASEKPLKENTKENSQQSRQVKQVKQVEQVGQVQQAKQVEIILPIDCKMKDYGKATMFKMPQGVEYSSFVFLAPTSMVHADTKNVRVVVPSNLEFTLKNDGRELMLTGEEMRTVLAGKEIGKSAQRTAPARRNVERLEALRNNVPSEMKEMPNWCVYRTKWNAEKGKKEKFVLSVHDGKWAKINDRNTWSDFETAYKYALENNCEGLSFALDGSGITCIDLDKCIVKNGQVNGAVTSQADGELNDVAKKLVPALSDTYCERSASGNGLHFFLRDDILAKETFANRAELPGGDEIEVYDTSRFISMTGDLFGKSEQSNLSNLPDKSNKLGKCPMQIMSWLRTALGPKNKIAPTQRSTERQASDLRYQSDSEVLERIRRSKKGEQFDTLYHGGDVTGDKSRDDLIMLNTLAFFTDCNEQQMRSIFEGSGRFRPETKNAAYVTRSIRKACDSLTVRFGQQATTKPDKGKK